MTIRIYDDPREAFEHIGWNGKGFRDRHTVTLKGHGREEREELAVQFYARFVEENFKKRRLDEQYDPKIMRELHRTFWEIIKNAEHNTSMGSSFGAEFYQGENGVLFGTRQDKDFLTQKQIDLLQQGLRVSTTKKGSCNRGIGIMLDFADGLVIHKKAKLIMVSKLVQKLR